MRRLFPNAGADEKPGIFFTWPKGQVIIYGRGGRGIFSFLNF